MTERTLTYGIGTVAEAPMAATLELVRYLDGVEAVSHVWAGDERFTRDAWVVLGAVAAVTRRLRMGPLVVDPFARHPALTATAMATLADASAGRAILGLGAGGGLGPMGLEVVAPATAIRETIGLCRLMWSTTETISYHGRTVSFEQGRLSLPVAARIPIAVAGRGPKVLEVGAELADMCVVATFVDGPLLEHSLASVAAGEARRDPSLGRLTRAAWVYLSIDDDPERARAAVRNGVFAALSGSRRILDELGIAVPDRLRAALGAEPASADMLMLIPDDLVAACSIAGTPDQCATAIRRLAAHGFEHIAFWPFRPAGTTTRRMIERLVDEVLPAVPEAAGPGATR